MSWNVKPLEEVFRRCWFWGQPSRRYPHRGWQRTPRAPSLPQQAACPAWRWLPSHIPGPPCHFILCNIITFLELKGTLTTKKRENGRKRTIRKTENRVSSRAHRPGPSSQSENTKFIHRNSKNLWSFKIQFELYNSSKYTNGHLLSSCRSQKTGWNLSFSFNRVCSLMMLLDWQRFLHPQ